MCAIAEPTTDLAGHDLSSLAWSADSAQVAKPLESANTAFGSVRSPVWRFAAREPSGFLMSNDQTTLLWPGVLFLILVVFGTATFVVTVSPAALARPAISASRPHATSTIRLLRVLSITPTSPLTWTDGLSIRRR